MSTLQYTFEDEPRTVSLTDGDPDKPLVVLIHGTGGTISDMTTPAQHPNNNYDFSEPLNPDVTIGWSAFPGLGVWSCCSLDDKKEVRSWRDILQMYGFRTAAYSQVDPNGFLDRPVRELAAVVAALSEEFPDARFVLLAQSRGGLLVRKFLRDHTELTRPFDIVITLHSPHTGSNLASIAATLRQLVEGLTDAIGPIALTALGWLLDMTDSDAFLEMAVGSEFLNALAEGEMPLKGIDYYTFGGVSTRLTRVRSWVYTASSAIPQWHLPPFLHERTEIEVPGVSPVADSLPNLIEELTDGRGDLLTADARTRLPFANHQTNPINHAETLWDPILQAQVLRILGEDVVVVPPDRGTSFWS